MELITERARIKTVAERWRVMYGPRFLGRTKAVYDRLVGMNLEKVKAGTVNQVIESPGWIRIECFECGKAVTKAVVLYDRVGGDAVFQICESCATKVKTLFKTGAAR